MLPPMVRGASAWSEGRHLRRLVVSAAGNSCMSPRGAMARAPRAAQLVRPALPRRAFSTAVFTVKPRPGETGSAQTLFVVGLNEGKFFGQDGAEEGLKLLERIAQHGPQYQLLFGLSERELNELEADHKVTNQRLTPSRELEGKRHGEVVPIMQAGMVDKRPRRALGRLLRTTQSHVTWMLWRHPKEAVQLYWAVWKRKEYKDAAARSFWSQHVPMAAQAYFGESGILIAIRATELLVASYNKGKEGTWVLVVSNQLFEPITAQLRLLLDDSAPERFTTIEFTKVLRQQATDLCLDVPDLTPVLVFVYLGLPILTLQFVLLALHTAFTRSGIPEQILPEPERRE